MEANRKKINAAFAKMKEEAKQLGVELLTDPETFIDDDHLYCVWYGGYIEASCTRTTRWPLRCMEKS